VLSCTRPPPAAPAARNTRRTRRLRALAARLAVLSAIGIVAACATRAPPQPAPDPDAVRAEIRRRMPATVPHASAWAADIQAALTAQRLSPMAENICAVLAVIEQESG